MTEKETRAFPQFTIPTVKKSKIYKQNFHFFAFYSVFTAVLRICVFAGNLPGDEKNLVVGLLLKCLKEFLVVL